MLLRRKKKLDAPPVKDRSIITAEIKNNREAYTRFLATDPQAQAEFKEEQEGRQYMLGYAQLNPAKPIVPRQEPKKGRKR